MKDKNGGNMSGMDEYKAMKLGKIFIIPAIVALLILVIIIGGRAVNRIADTMPQEAASLKENTRTAVVADTGAAIAAEEPSEGEAENSVTDNKSYQNDFTDYGLQKDAVPEIRELVTKYQRAKVTGDAKLMYEVFGRTDDEGFSEMQAKLEEEKSAFESYENTACYTVPGIEDGSYIVYISSRIKFAGIDTSAPMLTWAYVVKKGEQYVMLEPDRLSDEQQKAVTAVSTSEDVALLDREMRQELAQAVVGDPHLAALYQAWSEPESSAEENPAVITGDGKIIIHDGAEGSTEKETNGKTETLEEVKVKIGE